MEEKALEKEQDSQSVAQLEEVRREMGAVHDELSPLLMRYRAEKARLDEIKGLQKKREELLLRLEAAERRMDLAIVADLRYGG